MGLTRRRTRLCAGAALICATKLSSISALRCTNERSPSGLRQLELTRLPLYAPELNPMENVWDYLRGNKLSSLVWDSYDAILDACEDAWNFLTNDPERIGSIGTRSWA